MSFLTPIILNRIQAQITKQAKVKAVSAIFKLDYLQNIFACNYTDANNKSSEIPLNKNEYGQLSDMLIERVKGVLANEHSARNCEIHKVDLKCLFDKKQIDIDVYYKANNKNYFLTLEKFL